MVTKRTGKPRGRRKGSKKDFRSDPDRFVIAYASYLENIKANPKGHLSELIEGSIYYHRNEIIPLPEKPLAHSRRLGLDEKTIANLLAGGKLEQFGPRDGSNYEPSSDVRRIERKLRRWRRCRDALAWLHAMYLALDVIYGPLPHPEDGMYIHRQELSQRMKVPVEVIELVLMKRSLHRAIARFAEAGELPYFFTFIYPAIARLFER